MNYRESLKRKQTIVVKIGTSSLTFPNGRLNLKRIEKFVDVVAKLHSMGKGVVGLLLLVQVAWEGKNVLTACQENKPQPQ